MKNHIDIRHDIRPGDTDAVIRLHQVRYGNEFGFDDSFLDHVSEPFQQFAATCSPRNRLWIAEQAGEIVGCIAVVEHSPTVARLRWFLLAPQVPGMGLGKNLLNQSFEFCKSSGYDSLILWTISALTAAAHLYRSAGFVKVEELPNLMGGKAVIDERYELHFTQRRDVS